RLYDSFRRNLFEGKESCANTFEFGFRSIKALGTRYTGVPGAHRIDCIGLVLDAHGKGACVRQNVAGGLEATLSSTGAWQKLGQRDNFTAKRQGNQTCLQPNCIYLPD